jgi:hypothetical protein
MTADRPGGQPGMTTLPSAVLGPVFTAESLGTPQEDLEAHPGLADAGGAADEQNLAAGHGRRQGRPRGVVRPGAGDALRRPAAAFPHQPGPLRFPTMNNRPAI